ncbi:hypothetical protein [Thermosulfuriphilus sp.]
MLRKLGLFLLLGALFWGCPSGGLAQPTKGQETAWHLIFGDIPADNTQQIYALVEKQIFEGQRLKAIVVQIGPKHLTIPVSKKVKLFQGGIRGEGSMVRSGSWPDLTPGTILRIHYLPQDNGRIVAIYVVGRQTVEEERIWHKKLR